MGIYSKDFKEKALKLAHKIGVKKAATQLGMPYSTLAHWRERIIPPIDDISFMKIEIPKSLTEQEALIRQLKFDNAQIREANRILKLAIKQLVELNLKVIKNR